MNIQKGKFERAIILPHSAKKKEKEKLKLSEKFIAKRYQAINWNQKNKGNAKER